MPGIVQSNTMACAHVKAGISSDASCSTSSLRILLLDRLGLRYVFLRRYFRCAHVCCDFLTQACDGCVQPVNVMQLLHEHESMMWLELSLYFDFICLSP